MKPDLHPNYAPVVFQDLSSDFSFLTKSTMSSKETVKWEDGNEYPLVKVDISSHSHPFYTGKQKTLDVGGRVDKFRRRYAGSTKADPADSTKTDSTKADSTKADSTKE